MRAPARPARLAARVPRFCCGAKRRATRRVNSSPEGLVFTSHRLPAADRSKVETRPLSVYLASTLRMTCGYYCHPSVVALQYPCCGRAIQIYTQTVFAMQRRFRLSIDLGRTYDPVQRLSPRGPRSQPVSALTGAVQEMDGSQKSAGGNDGTQDTFESRRCDDVVLLRHGHRDGNDLTTTRSGPQDWTRSIRIRSAGLARPRMSGSSGQPKSRSANGKRPEYWPAKSGRTVRGRVDGNQKFRVGECRVSRVLARAGSTRPGAEPRPCGPPESPLQTGLRARSCYLLGSAGKPTDGPEDERGAR